MSENTVRVRQYLRFYKNGDGKKTLNTDTASRWIANGNSVVAVLTDIEQTQDFETDPLTSISFSNEEKLMQLVTKKKEKIYVKRKLPGFRYIEIDHFYAIGAELPAKNKKDLSYVKELVKRGLEVHGVFYESRDCKTITSKIEKVNLEENSFETDMHVMYYLQ